MKYLYLLPLLIPLAACATLDEDQCRAADWQAIGEADGANGRTPDYLEKHARACNKFGIAPIRAKWEKGRQAGLPRYCQPFRAWKEGADGHELSPVCPVNDLPELEHENFRGLTYYRIGRDISDAESDIDSINRALSELAADDPARTVLYNQRTRLRLEILHLRAQRARYRY